MALFKKKEQEQKSKVDQAVELFNSFTDEEFDEFLKRTDLDGDGDVDETDAETEAEDNVENAEATETETDDNADGETEPQAEAETEAEVEQPMQEETPEQEPENAPEQPMEQPQEQPQENVNEKPQDADQYHSLKAEIDNLKDLVASLTARIDADKENEADNKQEFGIGMNQAGKEADGQSDLDRAKAKYWSF